MKLAPILSAGLALVVAACGADIWGDSKGDSYDSSVKQADEARKSGDLDTAIHIRTVVVKDGRLHVQAGGGTVADAKPSYEWNESVNKARAVFRAVEVACAQPDWT